MLKSEIAFWQEQGTWAVGLVKNPPAFSCDNGILFTVVAFRLELLDFVETYPVVERYKIQPGRYLRYPGSPEYMSHDDLTAAAFLHPSLAREICVYGDASGWVWPYFQHPEGNNLSRILDFAPSIRAAAGSKLSISDQLCCATAWIWDCFSPKSETSGKQLIWLKVKMCSGKGLISDVAAEVWKWRMGNLYPKGLGEMLDNKLREDGTRGYYKPDPVTGEPHPIVVASMGKTFT